MANDTNDRSLDPVVFGVAFGFVVVFCTAGAVFPEQLDQLASQALNWIITHLGWLFVLVSTGFVVFALVLALSPYGRIPLSQDDETPEFSTVSWVAMMFSAGMGIGLMFYGIYEPVSHYTHPFPGLGVAPNSHAATRQAMAYTFFHWGLHPWAIYAVVALAMGYSTYRKGRPNLVSAPFQSLLGRERIERGIWGRLIDIFALVATKFGGSVSLGLGALQIAGGIWIFTGIGGGFAQPGQAQWVALAVIVVLDILALISALTGVDRGIKWLSNANMVLAVVLALFVLIAGPTVFLLNLIPAAFGAYLTELVAMSFRSPAFGGQQWMGDWTLFFWAWWISWAPFVSTFIARISRGRTIREFVFGALLVPTVVSGLWFVILGGAGIHLQSTGQADIAGEPAPAVAFFTALREYPLFMVTGGLVMFLTAIFWVSGADAAAVVLAMLSSRGSLTPKKWVIAVWKISSAAVAAVLLVMGGLKAFETFTILVASPFLLVTIGLCCALYADLRRDPMRRGGKAELALSRRGPSSDSPA